MREKDRAEDTALSVQGELKKKLDGLEFIESATLIGLPIGEGRWLEKVNDYDNVIIVDSMTPEKYQILDNIFTELRNMSSNGIDVLYTIADGPMKPKTELPWEIFGHYIVHDKSSYRESPLVLVENSWQYEEPFLGTPLSELRKIPGVDKAMLLDTPMGIRHLREGVVNNEGGYLGWEETDGEMQMTMNSLKFDSPEERLELYFYSILRCASNTLRLITGDNRIGIGPEMYTQFEKTCHDFDMSNLPRDVYSLKRDLRQRKLILTDSFVSSYQLKTIDFLTSLEKYADQKK
jgi:hypothetical protein